MDCASDAIKYFKELHFTTIQHRRYKSPIKDLLEIKRIKKAIQNREYELSQLSEINNLRELILEEKLERQTEGLEERVFAEKAYKSFKDIEFTKEDSPWMTAFFNPKTRIYELNFHATNPPIITDPKAIIIYSGLNLEIEKEYLDNLIKKEFEKLQIEGISIEHHNKVKLMPSFLLYSKSQYAKQAHENLIRAMEEIGYREPVQW